MSQWALVINRKARDRAMILLKFNNTYLYKNKTITSNWPDTTFLRFYFSILCQTRFDVFSFGGSHTYL